MNLPSKPTLQKALENLNYFFAFIFALEFVLKIIGLGIVDYFSSFWNCLDSLIVAVSVTCSLSLGFVMIVIASYFSHNCQKGFTLFTQYFPLGIIHPRLLSQDYVLLVTFSNF